MNDRSVENAELFDFKQVDEHIEGDRSREEYYRELLDARDIAKRTFAEVLNTTGDVVEESLERQLYNKPVTGMQRMVLDAWLRKGFHFMTKIVPIGALAGAVIIGGEIREYNKERNLMRAEADVEERADAIFNSSNVYKSRVMALGQDPLVAELPSAERSALQTRIAAVSAETPEEFLVRRGCKDNVRGCITKENYTSFSADLDKAHNTVMKMSTEWSAAHQIIETQRTLNKTRAELDARKGTFNSYGSFQSQALGAYQQGIAAIERRDAAAAQSALAQIGSIDDKFKTYNAILRRAESEYAAVKAAGCRVSSFEDQYAEVKQLAQSGNVQDMEKATKELQEQAAWLKTKGELRVVGGVWIYQNRNPNQKNFYLKTQLVDGEPVWLPIQDDDREGRITKTPMWGEEVPEPVYRAVGADKMDNGIINNAMMGRKNRCETSFRYDYSLSTPRFHMRESQSRITPVNPAGDLSIESNWRH